MKFRLTAPHFIRGKVYPAGTEVGDGTSVPYNGPASTNMEGLDEPSKKAVAERRTRGVRPVESLQIAPDPKTPIFGKEASAALKIRQGKPGEPIQ